MTHGHVFPDAPPGGELNPNAGEDLGTRLVKKVPFERRGTDGHGGACMPAKKSNLVAGNKRSSIGALAGTGGKNCICTWWCEGEHARDGRTDEPGSVQAQVG